MNKFSLFNSNKITKEVMFRWFIIVFILLPLVPFILSSIGLLAYAFWPRDFSEITHFSIEENTDYITLSAHGVKDSPKSWSDELMSIMHQSPLQHVKNLRHQNISIDWQDFSKNVFICSTAGKKIGFDIGKKIATKSNVKGVHVIGHSCGAFVALGICEGVKSANTNIKVQTTYLDPVSVYGGVVWNYGLNNFGRCANFSDSYIDTQDNIPGSNQVLPHSVTFDVTSIRLAGGYNIPPHVWPTKYYVELYKKGNIPIFFNDELNIKNSFPKSPMLLKYSN